VPRSDLLTPRNLSELRRLQCLGCSRRSVSGGCPSFWNNVFNLTIGHCGQAGQYVAQISVGLDMVTPAAFDDRVNDGAVAHQPA